MIEEFRANDGVVDAPFPVALVHHKGAKSGVERITPLAMQEVDDGFAVFAAKRGADDNPAWYYNLLANPETTVEFGTETFAARAHEATGEKRYLDAAVAGAITTASAHRPSVVCGLTSSDSNRSTTGRSPVMAANVWGPRNCVADSVMTVRTTAPRSISRRAR